MSKSIVSLPKPTMSDLYEWIPELFIMGVFLVGSMIASGWVSLICLAVATVPAAWIIACRARNARRNARVLAEYDAELVAADARALAETREDWS